MQHSGGENGNIMLLRHDRDLYRGNGKPGLCTRMQVAEDRMDGVDIRCDKADESVAGVRRMFWAVILLLISILGTSIGTLVTRVK